VYRLPERHIPNKTTYGFGTHRSNALVFFLSGPRASTRGYNPPFALFCPKLLN
ncbi:hypothetical protein L9F63_019125, partial [Diploptera punctata]